jgi:hypothetical protein
MDIYTKIDPVIVGKKWVAFGCKRVHLELPFGSEAVANRLVLSVLKITI